MIASMTRTDRFSRHGWAQDRPIVAGVPVDVVAIDPGRNPLGVWIAPAPAAITYAGVGLLRHIVSTNGPMMGRRLPLIGQASKPKLGAAVAVGGAMSALAATAAQSCRRPLATLGATALGATAAGATLLGGWQPCGQVVRSGERNVATFDDEGPSHAYIARRGVGFAAHTIGDGHPPADTIDGSGGMIRIVRNGCAVGGGIVEPERHPVVGWGLVPTGHDQIDGVDGGVIIVASGVALGMLGQVMVELGATDAVATDPSGCALFACDGHHVISKPKVHRRSIQRFGLFCGSRDDPSG